MKKTIIPILVAALLLLVPFASFVTNAENESTSEIPDSTAITYGYLKIFKEQLKQEIIAELTANGGITIETPYNEITATKGQRILLSPNSELIYRGGGAVVVSCSMNESEGVKDMSTGAELFSGCTLEYGHIYFGEKPQKVAILITGETAHFTVRGGYEVE